MRLLRYVLIFTAFILIAGCSVLDDYLTEDAEQSTNGAAEMSLVPPNLTAVQGDELVMGTAMGSCWPDGPGTLCRDYMPMADWFESGDFLTAGSGEPIVFEFVEGRRPDGVTLSVYAEFPPSSPLVTLDLVPDSNRVPWEPSGLGAGDYIVYVFGWWNDAETGTRYDSVYIVAMRLES